MAVLSGPASKSILVVNAGSSSLKLRVLDRDDGVIERLDLPPVGTAGDLDGLRGLLRRHPDVGAIGHRFVHGGAEFRQTTVVRSEVLARLRALSDLAPLHNPAALAGLEATLAAAPGRPHVVCFDTAFHATLPPAARTYALPRRWTEEWRIRRYGFHGLSHAYVARRTPELLGWPAPGLRLVSCHLGAGASLAAIAGGRSVDTTMGFTPLEGLVMATRSGSVDPGILFYVMRRHRLTADDVEHALEQESGLLGLSRRSGDMRAIEEAMHAGDGDATLAFDVYVHRLCAGIASMAAALGGLDALTFTGGVGEGSAGVRHAVCRRLSFLGVALDEARNTDQRDGDRLLSPDRTGVAVLLVHAREDIEIAGEVRWALGG